MQNPTGKPFARGPVRSGASLLCLEYWRLSIWSFVLLARMQLLSALLTVSSPFATPGWAELLRRWFDRLQLDAAAFRQASRAWRLRQMVLRQAALARQEFRNPWA